MWTMVTSLKDVRKYLLGGGDCQGIKKIRQNLVQLTESFQPRIGPGRTQSRNRLRVKGGRTARLVDTLTAIYEPVVLNMEDP
jgi:hypothetical protein